MNKQEFQKTIRNMEPKFRVLDRLTGKMFPVGIIDYSIHSVYIEEPNGMYCERGFDDVELMQSTGLKDENGREIYEGDIVKYKYDDTNAFVEAVAYDEVLGGFGLVDNDAQSGCIFTFGELSEDIEFTSLEIVGNIYENHELLEGE